MREEELSSIGGMRVRDVAGAQVLGSALDDLAMTTMLLGVAALVIFAKEGTAAIAAALVSK
ncbi:hypothetical protein NKH73_22105 [Mesorhizobium sp. M0938]|uniref:hypothetical protein n=1 Tax=unclassified Mesorhizobium TaxID=325217 RepID=UPI0033353722